MFERSELHFLGWGSEKNKIYIPDEIGRTVKYNIRREKMYSKLGIKQEIIELSEKVEQELQEEFKKID